MSRTLNDDFDDEDGGSGSTPLEIERGSRVGSGEASAYDGSGRDLDDDFGDAAPAADLHLDLPAGSAAAVRTGEKTAEMSSSPSPQGVVPQTSGALGFPDVPDLDFASRGPTASRSLEPALPPLELRTSIEALPSAPLPFTSPSTKLAAQPCSAALPGGNASVMHSGAAAAAATSASTSSPTAFRAGDGGAATPSEASRAFPARATPARPDAASVIARYPRVSAEAWQAPRYAFLVVLRQLELRNELESLRRRRSPDVPLYEAALRAYDPKAFRLGMAINVCVIFVASVLFFLPVILRFMRAD